MKSEFAYRVLNQDGTFRGSGDFGTGPAKLWRTAGDLVRNLKLASSWDESLEERVRKAYAEGSTVIEYELVERRRLPVLEFLKEREK